MTNLTYTKAGDYYIPNLIMDDVEDTVPLGKYGLLRETFLQEHHPGTYTSMLLTGRLEPHLREIDQQAQEQMEGIVSGMMRQSSIDESLKARDPISWVQLVNSFIAQAEETVLAEIVYR